MIKHLVITGTPIPLKRPRFTATCAAVKVIDSQSKEKKTIKHIINNQWDRDPIQGPVAISVQFQLPIPNSFSEKRKAMLEGKYNTKKPDLDNLLKWVLDCMNGIVYKDDAQVYLCLTEKIYSKHPKTKIQINSLEEDTNEKIVDIEDFF